MYNIMNRIIIFLLVQLASFSLLKIVFFSSLINTNRLRELLGIRSMVIPSYVIDF